MRPNSSPLRLFGRPLFEAKDDMTVLDLNKTFNYAETCSIIMYEFLNPESQINKQGNPL